MSFFGSGSFIFRQPMQTLLSVEKTISEEFITAMYGSPVTLVRAPGVGYAVIPIALTVISHQTGHEPYTDGGSIFLKQGTTVYNINIDPGVLTASTNGMSYALNTGISGASLAQVANLPIVLTNDTQPFSDGTDTQVNFFLVYELVKL